MPMDVPMGEGRRPNPVLQKFQTQLSSDEGGDTEGTSLPARARRSAAHQRRFPLNGRRTRVSSAAPAALYALVGNSCRFAQSSRIILFSNRQSGRKGENDRERRAFMSRRRGRGRSAEDEAGGVTASRLVKVARARPDRKRC